MQNADLWRRLILPLGVAALLAFVVGVFVPWQGLFISLSTTFVGIMFTVSYVDYVLRRHERKRWSAVDTIMSDYLQQFAIAAVSQFRLAFGLGPEVLNLHAESVEAAQAHLKEEAVRLAEQVLKPMVMVGTIRMDQAAWKHLALSLNATIQAADGLVNLFGQRLEPEHLHLVLSIRTKATDILRTYATLPDILGVPDDELPQSSAMPSEHIKRAYTTLEADGIQEMLDLSARLLRSL